MAKPDDTPADVLALLKENEALKTKCAVLQEQNAELKKFQALYAAAQERIHELEKQIQSTPPDKRVMFKQIKMIPPGAG